VESGGTVQQQTLNFDPATGTTSPLRSKEDAHDYRYFPEPDIPPIRLDEAYLSEQRQQMPPLPWEVKTQLMEDYQLSDYNAELLTAEPEPAFFFLELAKDNKYYQALANLIINKILPWSKETDAGLAAFPLSAQQLAAFLNLIEAAEVSNSTAYQELFPAMLANPNQSPKELAKQNGWLQSSDADELNNWVTAVLADNPDKVDAYQKGKKGLIGFFMGEVMKRSKGQAEPKQTNALLREALEK
jgi:aspartyl-tRNA(Asn)/glutamyl-tRNA(Gln) amidotransferase subunit B